MIFLTIGTHEPFDRLVRAVDDWARARGCGDQVFGQITGRAGYVPTAFETVPSLSPETYRARCEASSFMVSHAGMGSIITALTFGKPIVVLPRRGHLNETRNDHQYATAAHLEGRPGLTVARTEADLPAALDRQMAGGEAGRTGEVLSPWADARLIGALESFIHKGRKPG